MGQVMSKSLCVKHNDDLGQNHKAGYCKRRPVGIYCSNLEDPGVGHQQFLSNPLGHTPLLHGRGALLRGL